MALTQSMHPMAWARTESTIQPHSIPCLNVHLGPRVAGAAALRFKRVSSRPGCPLDDRHLRRASRTTDRVLPNYANSTTLRFNNTNYWRRLLGRLSLKGTPISTHRIRGRQPQTAASSHLSQGMVRVWRSPPTAWPPVHTHRRVGGADCGRSRHQCAQRLFKVERRNRDSDHHRRLRVSPSTSGLRRSPLPTWFRRSAR